MTSAAYDRQKVALMTHMSCSTHSVTRGIAQKSASTAVVNERTGGGLENAGRVEHAVAMDEYEAWKQLLTDKNIMSGDYLPGGLHYIAPADAQIDINGKLICACAARKRPFHKGCLLYTSPSPRDGLLSRMPSSA